MTPENADMPEQCCAHLTLRYKTRPVGDGCVTGYWYCQDCCTEFNISRADRAPVHAPVDDSTWFCTKHGVPHLKNDVKICSKCAKINTPVNDGYQIRFVEKHGNVVQTPTGFVTQNEHWKVRGKRFDHEPTEQEIDACYDAPENDGEG